MKRTLLALFAVALLGADSCLAQAPGPRIEGIVVNGTQNEKPLAGAEVFLRADVEGALQPVAQTVTDRDGRFAFDKLPAGVGRIFLPGANHQGVHYPGPRIQAPPGAVIPPVKVVVFEAVAAPSPLVADLHEIDVHIRKGSLEITETFSIDNPSATTYVGQAGSGMFASTLSLSIPDGFERVTFHKEFLGRRFKLIDKRLVTDIPWTPGKREVTFTYHLPIEESQKFLEWSAHVPCALVRLRVGGENADRFESNLPRVAGPDKSTIVFESSGTILPAGHAIKLQLGSLPTLWIVYLRWSALGVLAALIVATAVFRFLRRGHSYANPQGDHADGQPRKMTEKATSTSS